MLRWTPVVVIAALAVGCSAPSDPDCLVDEDCPPGLHCREAGGECVYDCLRNTECPEGFVCTARGRCERGCIPTNDGVEDCDGVDNDCDGETDEVAERVCQRENEHGSCAGTERCVGGAWSCDALVPALEDCDGLDNDCDGGTDEELDVVTCPLTEGLCAGAVSTCAGSAGWSPCDYGADYEADDEASCDGLDNDCDGETDEDVDPLPECELGEQAGDGIDNNCDGLTDEPGGCMRKIHSRPVYIDMYEAVVFESPDCTGTRYGEDWADYPAGWPPGPDIVTQELYACSLPGLRPSRGVTWHQAVRACAAQGKYLCSKSEWATACNGSAVNKFPYGHSYQRATCNTFSAGVGDTVPGGSLPGCVSEDGCFDMSGNLWEWTVDTCEWDTDRKGVQGGSYQCTFCDGSDCETCDMDDPLHQTEIEDQHGCQTILDGWYCSPTMYNYATMGFRCCFEPE